MIEGLSDHGGGGGASSTSSVINLLNTIIGAGILAMPFALKANGILFGIFVVILAGLAAALGLYLQGLCSQFVPSGHASFFSLSKKTYPSLAVLFDVAIAVKCFGVGVSYLIITADLMPQIMLALGIASELASRRNFWILISMAIVGPLSFLKTLDSLKYTSLVALGSVGYLVILVIGYYFFGTYETGPIRVVEPSGVLQSLSVLPVVIFAFTCHQNMFSILNELSDRSESRVKRIVLTSILTSIVLYIFVGLAGYLTFGDYVGGNIVGMYPPSSKISTIGKGAIVILVVLSYPLQCHPCRASLNHIIHWIHQRRSQQQHSNTTEPTDNSSPSIGEESALISHDGDGVSQQSESDEVTTVDLNESRFVILTLVILILSIAVAMTVDSLEVMLAFVGSTGSTSISFILPGIFSYKLLSTPTKSLNSDQAVDDSEPLYDGSSWVLANGRKQSILKTGSLLLFIWGIAVLVVCLAINTYLLINKSK